MLNTFYRNITHTTKDFARGMGVTSYAQYSYSKVNTITGLKNSPFTIRNYQKLSNEIK
jgi:hypothetical protein